MIIKEMTNGNKVSYKLEGALLTVDDKIYDLQELQSDTTALIDIYKDDKYIANIIIPPYEYEIQEDENDVDGKPTLIQVKKPVDTDKVILQLWGI